MPLNMAPAYDPSRLDDSPANPWTVGGALLAPRHHMAARVTQLLRALALRVRLRV
jgi:hypothetical protein